MKFVVGGQMDKKAVAAALEKLVDGKAEVAVMSDIEAVVAVKSGQADYYFGACATGAGGALGIALGLLGKDKCITVAMPGKVLSDGEIAAAVSAGAVAFGFTSDSLEKVLPVLVQALLAK
jgi:hypothetical protein